MSSTSKKTRSSSSQSPFKLGEVPTKKPKSRKKRPPPLFTLGEVPTKKSRKKRPPSLTLGKVPTKNPKKLSKKRTPRAVSQKKSSKKKRPPLKLSIAPPISSSPPPTLAEYIVTPVVGDISVCSTHNDVKYNRNKYGSYNIEAGASSDVVYISCPPKVIGEQCLDSDTKYVVKIISSYYIETDGGTKRTKFLLNSDMGRKYFNREVKNQVKAAIYDISPKIVDHWICEVNNKHLGFIVMEYIKGAPLVDISVLSDDELTAIHILINRLHRFTKLIHNDLHPGNIIKQDNGEFKLIDFGLSYDNKGSKLERKMNEDNDRFTLNSRLSGTKSIPSSSTPLINTRSQ